ncbi:hypothetical protein C0995_003932 [Termitomyces sp. Mi166|nr:hypothetical protein C0995_003932 [Termitomyces sp. Mi166\
MLVNPVAENVLGTIALLKFAMGCLCYGKGKMPLVAALVTGSVILVIGGLEAGIVFVVRPSMNRRAIDFFGIFASVIIACGLLPQYYEIIKHREVIGISISFITIDWLGAVFSVFALFFRAKFDVAAGVAYSLVIVMDGVIILAAIVLNPLARRRRKQEAEDRSVPSPVMTQMASPEDSLVKEYIPSIQSVPPGRS